MSAAAIVSGNLTYAADNQRTAHPVGRARCRDEAIGVPLSLPSRSAHQQLQQPPPPFAGIPRLKCRGPVCPRNHQAYTADVASRCSVDPKNLHHRWGKQDLTKGVHPIARPLPGPKAALAELIELIELG